MYSISIGELQKNISLLTQLTDVFAIIDKRKNRVTPCDDLEKAKEMAMMEAMGDKYGFSN